MRKLIVAAGSVVLMVAAATPASAAPPVADSGPSVVTKVGTVAQLSGTASDPDGDPVEIRWLRSTFNGGSLASCSFSGPTAFEAISAAGLAPTLSCTQPGDYLMQLVAADGTSSFDSIGASVTFTPNHPPTAHSGPSVVVAAGTNAQLAGSASDPDGDALEIRWLRSVVSGGALASCTFSGPTAFEPISPDGLAPTLNCTQPGDYLMQLVVGDGELADDDTGALVTFTAARDRSPAECLAVRLRSGAYLLRLQDPESGVAGFRGTPLINVVLTPPGKSFPMPVAQTDIGVTRPTPWFPGAAFIRHINGAGVEGSCFIVSTSDGTLGVHSWP